MREMTDAMVMAREVPWMKLGRLVDEPMSVAEAAKMGGLDFTVSLRDIQFLDGASTDDPGHWVGAPSRKAVVRDDTGEFFDVVSADYGVLQYGEAFDFLSEINPKIVAAGTLKSGRQGFMVVQLPDMPSLDMLDLDDPHDLYTVVRTSHDRTRAVECVVTPLRHRCMNQMGLRSFGRGAPSRWSVHHVGDVAGKLADARLTVDNIRAYAHEFAETANRLYSVVLNSDEGRKIVERVVRPTAAANGGHRDETINKIVDMWLTRETVGFAGTGWGLVNAVSEYYEWERSSGNRTAQSQFLGALEGTSRKALDTVAALVLSRH